MVEGPPVAADAHREVLRGIEVRPILPSERGQWDALVNAHHYLGLRALVGKTLRYVALFQGRWLALLGWQGAALKCQSRDRWIGWSRVVQYQRLHLIANNARFLVLPGVHIPNLASRLLSLNLKRLARDWQGVHGHPVLLAETFVETPRFTGACYRAANWQVVGQTRGFAKTPSGYRAHHRTKQVLLYALHRQARRWLADPVAHPAWSHPMQTVRLSTQQLEALRHCLQALPDCRHRRGVRHRYASVLTIALGAVLGGARSYLAIAEWAQDLTQNQLKRLRARYNRRTARFEPPSESTLRRVLQETDAQHVDEAFGQWLMDNTDKADALAIDGKTLKGAVREDGTQVHLLSAFLQNQGVTVAQHEVDAKTNEIPELPRLLAPLQIQDRVVSADALHTQRETARYLVEDKQAHYLFTVKENQPTLLNDIATLPWERFPPRG